MFRTNGISRVSTWMCGAIYVQDERYIAGEHMDVR